MGSVTVEVDGSVVLSVGSLVSVDSVVVDVVLDGSVPVDVSVVGVVVVSLAGSVSPDAPFSALGATPPTISLISSPSMMYRSSFSPISLKSE